MGISRDNLLAAASLIVSIVVLAVLFGTAWHFQSSLNSLQNQVSCDRKIMNVVLHIVNFSSMCQMHIDYRQFIVSNL